MKRILYQKDMMQCDKRTIEDFFVPSEVLMERAALSVVRAIFDEGLYENKRFLILAGTGHNGGDGLCIARLLREKGIDASFLLLGDEKNLDKVCKRELLSARAYGAEEFIYTGSESFDFDVIIDAIFGIGLKRELSGDIKKVVCAANNSNAVKVAVDMPSGVFTDTGDVIGTAFKADITVTFSYIKPGLLLYPGKSYTGRLLLFDIGIKDISIEKNAKALYAYEDFDIRRYLKERREDSNKGTFGKVLSVCGSRDIFGAAYLASKAALLSGAGMVKVLTHEKNRDPLFSLLPEALISTYSDKINEKEILNLLSFPDIILMGPGLSTDKTGRALFDIIYKNSSVPMVLDADALNIISDDISVLSKPHTEIVITPHLKEMSRLTGESVSFIKENLIRFSEEFSRDYQVICHLKDSVSVTSIPYKETYINTSGNSGMATAGSGDVLSGIIAGLMATGLPASRAASLGAFIHGVSGDVMVKYKSKESLLSSDLLLGLVKVFNGERAI